MTSLKRCVETRLRTLSDVEESPRKYLAGCEDGMLCAIAEEWVDQKDERTELARRYRAKHPEMVESAKVLTALESWFDNQRKTEIAAMQSMLARIDELPNNPPANAIDLLRVDLTTELLGAEDFTIDAGVPGVAPWSIQLASFYFGMARLELRRLETVYKQKHPAVIAQTARLENMRGEFETLVEFHRARLQTARSKLESGETSRPSPDTRVADSRQSLEQLLDMLEAAQAIPSPNTHDIRVLQACSTSSEDESLVQ